MATTPTNRLTRNTQRHPSLAPAAAMISPPSSGPIAVETPITAPSRPKARDRAGPVKVCWMVALIAGKNSPAPRPWTIRAATIWSWSCAMPQATLARVKMVSPVRKSRLAPNLSPARPPGTRARP